MAEKSSVLFEFTALTLRKAIEPQISPLSGRDPLKDTYSKGQQGLHLFLRELATSETEVATEDSS
jgi:hypothetical protein